MKLPILLIALVAMVAAKSAPGRMAARYDHFRIYQLTIETNLQMEELKKIHEHISVSTYKFHSISENQICMSWLDPI